MNLVRVGGQVVDLARMARRPGPGNTGVPVGAELAPSSTTSTARRDFNGTTPEVVEGVDFTDVRVVMPDLTANKTFRRCRFAVSAQIFNHSVQLLGRVDSITFDRCTFVGSTTDPYLPLGIPIASASKTLPDTSVVQKVTNLTVTGCDFSGYNDSWNWTFLDGCLFERNYLHDMVIDKSADTTPDKSNPVNWSHPDATQVGAVDFWRNITVRGNYFRAVAAPPNQALGNAVLQVGQMRNQADVHNVQWVGNWCEGGAYMFNANQTTPINVTGGFVIRDNLIYPEGLRYGVRSPSFNQMAPTWTNNRWATTGTTDYGLAVTAGELVP